MVMLLPFVVIAPAVILFADTTVLALITNGELNTTAPPMPELPVLLEPPTALILPVRTIVFPLMEMVPASPPL